MRRELVVSIEAEVPRLLEDTAEAWVAPLARLSGALGEPRDDESRCLALAIWALRARYQPGGRLERVFAFRDFLERLGESPARGGSRAEAERVLLSMSVSLMGLRLGREVVLGDKKRVVADYVARYASALGELNRLIEARGESGVLERERAELGRVYQRLYAR